MRNRSDGERGMGGALWGLGLIAAGIMILLEHEGYMPWHVWAFWWPLVVIGFGLARLVSTRTPKGLDEGVTWTLMGGWFLIASNNWHGLSWGTSWPLALVAVGGGTLARSIGAPFMRGKDKESAPAQEGGVYEAKHDA